MSNSLRSYPEPQREIVARRRAKAQTKGNGYWAAMAYLAAKGMLAPIKESSKELSK